jgi:hypothetical protein
MADFLDTARDILVRSTATSDRETLNWVLRGIGELQAAQSKGTLDLKNIESVFAAFEMANLFGQLGSLKPDEVKRLPANMGRLIVRTLDGAVRFPIADFGSQPASS